MRFSIELVISNPHKAGCVAMILRVGLVLSNPHKVG
mgnify:CR=1 FL=1